MSILSIAKTYRSLRRMKEIVQVLTRHGFGHIVAQMNLLGQLPLISRIGKIHPSDLGIAPKETLALRARLAMEELGPTFVKLGQVLSLRPDVVGVEFVVEFAKLQDRPKPFPGAEAAEVVRRELGTDPFAEFDPEPKASGSMAQVHNAKLHDGTAVVVKIKRPGIDDLVAKDLDLLEVLARLAEEYVPELRIYRPAMLAEEFSRQLARELNFTFEASTTMRFAEMFKGNPAVKCPAVFWEHTTRNVLTMERIEGFNIGDSRKLAEMGVDRRKLATELGRAFMKQYFAEGLFQADPHPGNMLVDSGGVLGLIDFGMTGHLTDEFRSQLGHMIVAVGRRDLPLLADLATDIGVFKEPVDERGFKSDLLELLDMYYEVPLVALDTSEVFTHVMRVARRNNILFPRDFVLLGRSLMLVVETCKKLDPEFSLKSVADPYTAEFIKSWLGPGRILSHLHQLSWNMSALVKRLPSDLRLILGQVKAGNARFRVRLEGTETLERNIENLGSRLALSATLGSLLIASSLLCVAKAGPMAGDVPVLGIAGFVLAGMAGAGLVLRSIRRRP